MAEKVPAQVARERNRLLRDLASRKRQAFMQSFIGRSVEAITLSSAGNDQEGEYTSGLTDNYLSIRVKGSHPPNQWMRVEVERLSDETLVGRAN